MDLAKTVHIAPGRYVVAVSGGVDSMVLLDLLVRLSREQQLNRRWLGLVVAHFDHGVRQDSRADRQLVQRVAEAHGLPFVYNEGKLGPHASEDTARKARYAFLRTVRTQSGARGIITAHHLDDSVETAIHNILRGTGRRGMSSLQSTDGIIRPLLHVPKDRLQAYAHEKGLEWHEDSTNANLAYRRNYIRKVLLPRIKTTSPKSYEDLKVLVRRQRVLNQAIDLQLTTLLHIQPSSGALARQTVAQLPHATAVELVAHWLREQNKRQFDSKLLERLTIAIKTARPGTIFVVDGNTVVRFGVSLATIEHYVRPASRHATSNPTGRAKKSPV